MISNEIETAFDAAAKDFNNSLALMQPNRRNGNEGYCEANFVEYYSHALRQRGYRPFLELPIPRGRIDGLFWRDSTFLLLEAKQLYRESIAYVSADLDRLTLIDLAALLHSYGLSTGINERLHIALCDCWTDAERQQWIADPPVHPFLSGYTTRTQILPNGYSNRDSRYAWLLAYKKVV